MSQYCVDKLVEQNTMDVEDIIDELLRLRNELDKQTYGKSKEEEYRFSYTSLAICEAIRAVYNYSVIRGLQLELSEDAKYMLGKVR